MTAKKGTMVGLQPAAPPESRAPGALRQTPPSKVPAPAGTASAAGGDPDDNAKTIAFVPGASPLKDLLAKKKINVPASAPKIAPAGKAVVAKPSPGLPSKTAAPPPVGGRPSGHMRAAPAAPPRATVPDAEPPGDGLDFGDGGMADAEAALEAMQSFRLAEAALQRNDVAAAEQLAHKAVQGDPSQADYVTLLAWVRALGGDPSAVEKAVSTMSKVLIEDPSNERALLYRGKLLARTNRLHEALNDLSELLSANPHHREAAAELRNVKQLLGQ